MAAFTISQDRNFHDAFFASRSGADSYTVNVGKTLTIDCDSRYGPNTSPTTGVIGDGSNYGTFLIDATNVRLIPFASGAGTVPAPDTVISKGGVSAKLIGVWASLTSTPLATGAAMPSSGFIKVRQKTTGSFSAGALSGISASASGADVAGWIEVAALASGGISCGGLTANYKTLGDWFELGVTTGAAQLFQAPCSVGTTHYGGCFVEKAPGSSTFEFWPAVGQLNDAPTDERGKVSFVDSAGQIRIGNNGSAAKGFIPAAGLRVVVPNIVLVNTNSTVGYAQNVGVVFGASRFNFVAAGNTGYGLIDCRNAVFNWNFVRIPASASDAANCAFVDMLHITSGLSYAKILNSGLGASGVSADTQANQTIVITAGAQNTYFEGFVCYAQKITGSTIHGHLMATYASKVYVKDSRFILGQRDSSSGRSAVSMYSGKSAIFTFENTEFIGCGLYLAGANTGSLKNIRYADKFLGTQDAAAGYSPFQLGGEWTCDGLEWVTATVDACHPYGALFLHAGNFRLRNVGAPGSALSLGTTNKTERIVADSGSAKLPLYVDRVYTTAPRVGGISSVSVPTRLQNVSHLAFDIIDDLPGMIVRSVRAQGSQHSSYATAGLPFMDYYTADTEGELIFTGAAALNYSEFAGVNTFSGGAYADGGGIVTVPAGGVALYETPWFVRGHTGFKNTGQFLSAGDVPVSGASIEYDIDKGSGYSGMWKTATGANMSAESGIDPAVGFKLKVRVTGTTGTSYRPCRIVTTTTLGAQSAYLWPLDPVTITVNNLVSGSIVKVTRTDTSAVLFTGNEASGQVSFTADYSGQILVEARKASGSPYYQPWTALATVAGDITVTAVQIRDDR